MSTTVAYDIFGGCIRNEESQQQTMEKYKAERYKTKGRIVYEAPLKVLAYSISHDNKKDKLLMDRSLMPGWLEKEILEGIRRQCQALL